MTFSARRPSSVDSPKFTGFPRATATSSRWSSSFSRRLAQLGVDHYAYTLGPDVHGSAQALQIAGARGGVGGFRDARADDHAREGGELHLRRHRHRIVEGELGGEIGCALAPDGGRQGRAFRRPGKKENEVRRGGLS